MSYTFHVKWSGQPDMLGDRALARTGRDDAVIYFHRLDNAIRAAKGDHSQVYANVLLHEMLWHGALGYSGHPGDKDMSEADIRRSDAPTGPCDVSPICEELAKKFGISIDNGEK